MTEPDKLYDREEHIAELQYEAGMYRSLYDVAKTRIEALEAALREIENKVSVSQEPMLIKLAIIRNTARAALDKDEGK